MKKKKEKYDFDSDPAFQKLVEEISKLAKKVQEFKQLQKKLRRRKNEEEKHS